MKDYLRLTTLIAAEEYLAVMGVVVLLPAFPWALSWLLALLGVVPEFVTVEVWKLNRQIEADRMRQSYELTFPRGMTPDHVMDFIDSTIGELPQQGRLDPAYALCFEKYGDIEGKRWYLHVPGHLHGKVDRLLTRMVDGVIIDPVKPESDRVRNTAWQEVVEIAIRGTTAPLDVAAMKRIAASIDANFDNLADDERLVAQWVVKADRRRKPTLEDKDKVTPRTLHAVLRLGATGRELVKDRRRKVSKAHQHLSNLKGSFKRVNSGEAQFVKHPVPGVARRIHRRSATTGFPIFLNVNEFTALVGWPLDGGTGPIIARKLRPDRMHDKPGLGMINLGISDHHDTRGQLIVMPYEAGDMHMRIMGGTGTGKSTFLLHYGLQAMMRPDTAFILLEPAGELAWDFMQRIPPHRVKDVIYLNLEDENWPIGLNPLEGGKPERVTSHVVSIFKNLSGDSWSPQIQRVMTNAVMTAAILGLTLYDVRLLLTSPEYRAAQLRKLNRKRYPIIFDEWDWITGKHEWTVDSSVNRLTAFLGSDLIRRMVSQKKGLNFDDLIREHKILICPLPGARVGWMEANAVGQLIREMAQNAAMKQKPATAERSIVMMDEFQNYSDFETSKSDPFAEARKYKQQYVIAHQTTDQAKAVQATVSKNVATQMVFRLDPDDAKVVKDRYKPLTEDDISHLPRFTVAARIMTSTGLAPIVTFTTLPPPAETGHEHEIIARTRMNYAKPVAEVDANILARHKSNEPKQRMEIGEL